MSRVGRINVSANRFFELPTAYLSLISGLLLALNFLNFPLGFTAWFALIPFLIALHKSRSKGEALLSGFLFGGVFFLLSIAWLRFVTFFGWAALVGIETSFIVLCAWAVYAARRTPVFFRIVWFAVVWTACEVFRSEIPVFGFGWNLLSYSQWPYAWVIQFANLGGAYGLSFVMALVNAALAEGCIHFFTAKKNSDRKTPALILGFILTLSTIVFSHGFYWSHRPAQSPARNLRISVLQGNIPEELENDPVIRDKIIGIYSKLTELAQFDQSELIIWPEAAFPGYFNRDINADSIHTLARTSGIPMIVGSPHFEEPRKAYNSAYFLGPTGEIKNRYDKQKLVPFGEYVPLLPIFGWLEPMAHYMGVSDFSSGKESTVFSMMNKEFKFSTLICFEDTFQRLTREFVDNGAEFLVVITNDSWFKKTAAPYQHMHVSMFRAVENGVPVIRAANTGVSTFISSTGKELARLRDEKGRDIFIAGRKTFEMPIDPRLTYYRRGGWVFGYAVFGLFVIIGPVLIFRSGKFEV